MVLCHCPLLRLLWHELGTFKYSCRWPQGAWEHHISHEYLPKGSVDLNNTWPKRQSSDSWSNKDPAIEFLEVGGWFASLNTGFFMKMVQKKGHVMYHHPQIWSMRQVLTKQQPPAPYIPLDTMLLCKYPSLYCFGISWEHSSTDTFRQVASGAWHLIYPTHCKRDWWNSGAKQELSWLYAGKILALC